MYKSNVNFNLLEGYLGFLIKQGMVNEKITKRGRKFYSITEQGVTVLKYFRHLIEVLPIVEETGDKTKHQRPYLFQRTWRCNFLETRKKINSSMDIINSRFSYNEGIARGSVIRVLHVDDDDCILRVSKLILEMSGAFQVETALSVGEAFDKMGKFAYDVVVSDYHMPGQDGLQFLKALREKGNRISFLLFSGENRHEIRIKALSFGADGYFNKIGSPETVYGDLLRGIESAIARARTELKYDES